VQESSENQLTRFRLKLYHWHFNKRDDCLMDLLDALCSNTQARSVVELSQSPHFLRDYNSLFKSIAHYQPAWVHATMAQLAAPYLPRPQNRPFFLLGVDVTSYPRPYARKLSDRQYVYQPNILSNQKPITWGHQYSDICLLEERPSPTAPHWVIPLDTIRVRSGEDKEMTGASQIRLLLEDTLLPFKDHLCVEVADSAYCKPSYLSANRDLTNLVSILRVRSNRLFYRQSERTETYSGHPTWFGPRFALNDPTTWPAPEDTLATTFTSYRHHTYRLEIEAWHNLLMRGRFKPQFRPMQDYPFTLLRIRCYNTQTKAAQQPLWLLVIGQQRHKLSLAEIWQAYQQRYDLEHFFRFGKQKLLLDRYQASQTEYEEHWWQLVHLAYLQLWVARPLASSCPRPWERYLPRIKEKILSPAMVQRSFAGIRRQFGTPAQIPKRRGYSPGRPRGMKMPVRLRQPIIIKSKI
jgi:hypothetical protein